MDSTTISTRKVYLEDSFFKRSIDPDATDRPTGQFLLYQNYPNPFNPSTEISIRTPETSRIRLTVRNTLGVVVATLCDGVLNEGVYSFTFDGTSYPSGTYIYMLETDTTILSHLMSLVK
jgi:hypothetical protein